MMALPSTGQTVRTHLYKANQEILFEPMKRIQMDSDHQLKINVSDKSNQKVLFSTSVTNIYVTQVQ